MALLLILKLKEMRLDEVLKRKKDTYSMGTAMVMLTSAAEAAHEKKLCFILDWQSKLFF